MAQWRCLDCGARFGERPASCPDCGGDVFEPVVGERVVPEGIPTSAAAVRREAREREVVAPVSRRGVAFVVIVTTAFVVLTTLVAAGVL